MTRVHVSLWELNNRDRSITFPVPPETFPTTVNGKAESTDIVGVGERVIFGGEKLATFSFSSFFPAQYDPTYVVEANGTYGTPDELIRILRGWVDAERPLYLYSKEAPINREVVITNLKYERERAGHVGDVWFEVEFKTYKAPHFRSVTLKQASGGNGGIKAPDKKATAPNADKLPATYTVKQGDSLSRIAQIHYGKADYMKIFNANNSMIRSENMKRRATDQFTIYPGMKLTIPK